MKARIYWEARHATGSFDIIDDKTYEQWCLDLASAQQGAKGEGWFIGRKTSIPISLITHIDNLEAE